MPTERGAEIGAVLAELAAARVPWLALALRGSAGRTGQARSVTAGEAVVIDLTDPNVPPVMVNPLEPERGYPVQAHADRVAGLFEAAFALPGPVATAIRTGLRRAYTNAGWDALTGATPPALVSPSPVPAFHQLRHAVLAAAEDLGYDRSMRAAVRGFVQARLEPLWAGPAGRFLEGGHPADAGRLLKGNIILLASDIADAEAQFFLSGVLLTRVAEALRGRDGNGPVRGGRRGGEHHRHTAPDPRFAIVVTEPGGPGPGSLAAEWLGRMVEDLHAYGAEVVAARGTWDAAPVRAERATAFGPEVVAAGETWNTAPGRAEAFGPEVAAARGTWDAAPVGAERATAFGPEVVAAGETWNTAPRRAERPTAAGGPGQAGQFSTQVLRGRRSAACGGQCIQRRPCDGYELSVADLLAHGDGQVWLRLWVQTLMLAFLTGRPLPRVPPELRSAWRALSPRTRECVLATILDGAVTTRATALRRYYDPRCLLSVAAAVAVRLLDGSADAPFRAGQLWVIPQLRWLHETERLNPLGQDTIGPDDIAPPLDFGLAGLPDWPGIRVRDRLGGLQRHPLSMESARNRRSARIALLGEDGRGSFDVDLAAAAIGLSAQARLRYAARMMGAGAPGSEPGWLEVVLSWPHRIIRPSWYADLNPRIPAATG